MPRETEALRRIQEHAKRIAESSNRSEAEVVDIALALALSDSVGGTFLREFGELTRKDAERKAHEYFAARKRGCIQNPCLEAEVWQRARDISRKAKHSFLGSEHLLAALLELPNSPLQTWCGPAQVERLLQELRETVVPAPQAPSLPSPRRLVAADLPARIRNHWLVTRLLDEIGSLSDDEWRHHPVVQSIDSKRATTERERVAEMVRFVEYMVSRIDESAPDDAHDNFV